MYSRIPDELADDACFDAAGLLAVGLWTFCDAWAGKQLTNGFIPKGIAERYAKGKRPVIRACVDNGLWVECAGRIEHGEENVGKPGFESVGYRTRNDVDHMDARIKKAATTAARRDAGAKGGAAAAEKRRALEQQAGQQTARFATATEAANHPVLLQQTSSPAALPETRDQRPPVANRSLDHHHQHIPRPEAAVVAKRLIDTRLKALIDLATQVAYNRSPSDVRSPSGWRDGVRNRLYREHGADWLAVIEADPTGYDPARLIAEEASTPLEEVRTAIRRIRRTEDIPA